MAKDVYNGIITGNKNPRRDIKIQASSHRDTTVGKIYQQPLKSVRQRDKKIKYGRNLHESDKITNFAVASADDRDVESFGLSGRLRIFAL